MFIVNNLKSSNFMKVLAILLLLAVFAGCSSEGNNHHYPDEVKGETSEN